VINQLTGAQEERNALLKREIAKLDKEIADIQTLQREIDDLKARKKAVEDLQTDRNTPVRLLDEFVKRAPDGIYFTSIKQVGNVVAVGGLAQTNERVSELLTNFLTNSPWLEKPELVEIKAVNVGAGTKEARRLFEFSMKVPIKKAAAPAGSASAPAAAASRAKAS
jgi:type IV pilus assembly protein PilN